MVKEERKKTRFATISYIELSTGHFLVKDGYKDQDEYNPRLPADVDPSMIREVKGLDCDLAIPRVEWQEGDEIQFRFDVISARMVPFYGIPRIKK